MIHQNDFLGTILLRRFRNYYLIFVFETMSLRCRLKVFAGRVSTVRSLQLLVVSAFW